ncbi:hypothetical protein [Accumulibacter sp.]|jgi:hypothetical protein|uniref:Uncharacterized protein n=1 Tax=Accumulibacter regalis TaxID=522306 RepID=C7RPV1_ACCRE|nr:hypothetical protein [Accumulibacter sp.]MBN8496573.1 hypothetical protein [Accumulibacter sp.]MBO3714327.1 hypothetical protein [Accumulibacter sp.]
MGDLIEHSENDNGNVEVVRVGEAGSRVSLKVYQDIYHQVTGRTEQIRKRYSDNLLVEFAEVEQLHFKVQQLCDVHKIVARNEVISVFHDKERKEQFTSFDRFRAYNTNAASPTVSIVLKYNFSIVPAGLELPQEYAVSIRLTSRAAMLQQIEQEAPPFLRGHLAGFVALITAEVTIDYADYVIARGFLEAFDEWLRGCRKTPPVPFLNSLRRWSGYIPGAAKLVVGALLSWFAFQSVPTYFNTSIQTDVWARFFVVYAGGALILVPLMGTIGSFIEEAIDSYPDLSYLKLNKGDINLIDEFSDRKRAIMIKIALSGVFAVALNIVATKLERFL